uniref:RNase III domain-containing protein n=1 Tax=Davidia involucrata TaxID=16924 RepID=A0A5B7BFW5_DAVIN
MNSREFVSFVFLAFAIYSPFQVLAQAHSADSLHDHTFKPTSPFSAALTSLQIQIGYKFQSIGLLRRAMTHPSYSEDNNRALSVLGANVIETSVALRSLSKDIEISAKDLNRQISEISKVESSCAIDGMGLGLQKVVRVSRKTNSSAPAVVCCAFRAIFGAIAIDIGKSDDAGSVFWSVHGGNVGRALPL